MDRSFLEDGWVKGVGAQRSADLSDRQIQPYGQHARKHKDNDGDRGGSLHQFHVRLPCSLVGAIERASLSQCDASAVKAVVDRTERDLNWTKGQCTGIPEKNRLEPDSLFGRTRNSAFYSTLIWDVDKAYRIAFEATYRKTDYKSPNSTGSLPNEGFGFHTQLQWGVLVPFRSCLCPRTSQ